ncbi:hypothetical protein GCM10010273_54670 [Streptomyces lavendulocolor]
MRAVGRLDGGAGRGVGGSGGGGGVGMRGHAAQGKDAPAGAGMAILYAESRRDRQGVGAPDPPAAPPEGVDSLLS